MPWIKAAAKVVQARPEQTSMQTVNSDGTYLARTSITPITPISMPFINNNESKLQLTVSLLTSWHSACKRLTSRPFDPMTSHILFERYKQPSGSLPASMCELLARQQRPWLVQHRTRDARLSPTCAVFGMHPCLEP